MSNLKERQQQLREDTIIEIAHQLLSEQGYNALNMDELASRVGVSKATLYQHFPSKDELVIRIILKRMQEGENTMRAFSPHHSPLEILEEVLRYSIEKRLQVATSRFELPPNLREDPRIKERHTNMAAWLAMLIKSGQADGTIRRDLSIPVIVRMFYSFFTPSFHELLVDGIVTPQELGETVISIFLRGICTS